MACLLQTTQINIVMQSNTAVAAAVAGLMLTAIAALLGPAKHGKQSSVLTSFTGACSALKDHDTG